MAPPRTANPTPEALKKRELRQQKLADPAFKEAELQKQRDYRAKKKLGQEAAIAAAGPAAEGGPPAARKELAKCQAEVCTEAAKVLGQFFDSRVKDAEAARRAAPELKRRWSRPLRSQMLS